jgi:hypothetical protein
MKNNLIVEQIAVIFSFFRTFAEKFNRYEIYGNNRKNNR